MDRGRRRALVLRRLYLLGLDESIYEKEEADVIFVGIDWSEAHHDVELQSSSGKSLKALRISNDVVGVGKLQEVLLELEEEPSQVVIGIEAQRGLLVDVLVSSGYQVYAVNPLTSARAREGESLARSKSDRGDARLLANLVRTKRQQLRKIAGDSDLAQAIRVRARSHLRALRVQQRLRNQLRNCLMSFYPAALPLLGEEQDLRDALAVLSVAPSPELGRRASLNKLSAALRRHGRQRNLESKATQIQGWLRQPQLALGSTRAVAAYADEAASLTRMLIQVRHEVAQLEEQMGADFDAHPDAEIYRSLPGLAHVLGARVLGEAGDDSTRYADAKARKNYFGNSPVTRASGTKRVVSRRVVRNRILADAVFLWARSSLNGSAGARRYYDQLRSRDKTHNEAIRALANRLAGILHGCLRTRRPYDETTAWPASPVEVAA